MEGKLSSVAKQFKPSPIQELSHLAQKRNAINLAEGFPDFPAPLLLKSSAISAINSDFNQYRHVQGICDHLAMIVKEMHGLNVNPLTDIAICCGQSEAFAAAVFATIDKDDEVILFDPSYETYEACVTMARGVPNPTGKVFTGDELELIAEECRARNCFAITDEVYEHITFDNNKHISLASLPGMQERTIITSSLSKSFSVTGWRVGWAIAPPFIASAIRNIHVKLTDSAPAPFQEAALTALSSTPEYFESLRSDYESKRDYVMKMLEGIGFKIQFKPQGSFFLFAELPEDCPLSDVEYVKELIQKAGVVAVPGCGFFHTDLAMKKSFDADYAYQNS
ncbi:hypothetical protein TIFTF001_021514 [Ficus carica]|uniref:Aminotransferase class I/classII large domain-containing protein n=1 Tax=Ficus carica TaxID=3494 RepID=A0AA88ACV5_FICCA|nr:hypothetical protein TIFTF001_021514 [Ficus carica]